MVWLACFAASPLSEGFSFAHFLLLRKIEAGNGRRSRSLCGGYSLRSGMRELEMNEAVVGLGSLTRHSGDGYDLLMGGWKSLRVTDGQSTSTGSSHSTSSNAIILQQDKQLTNRADSIRPPAAIMRHLIDHPVLINPCDFTKREGLRGCGARRWQYLNCAQTGHSQSLFDRPFRLQASREETMTGIRHRSCQNQD